VFTFKYRSLGKLQVSTRLQNTNSYVTETLQALGIVPRPSSSTPASSTASVPKLGESNPQPTPAPHLPSPTPLPRQPSAAPSLVGATPFTRPTPLPSHEHHAPSPNNGLAKDEIIAMITVYRGSDTGLAAQNTKSLLGLLRYYEASTLHPLHTRSLTRRRKRISTTRTALEQGRTAVHASSASEKIVWRLEEGTRG
jgi:hypothetical protein